MAFTCVMCVAFVRLNICVLGFVNPYKTMPEQTTCLVNKFDTEFFYFITSV